MQQFNDHLFCCFCDESGTRQARGGRSMGGTVAGGGGGHGGGLCAGCVSLSGNHGQLYGNDSRYGNGSLGRGGNGRNHRGSTWENSDRMMSKRKSTWETQTTVVNHRVLNMTNGGIGAAANIHVNLCSEPPEHIPLLSMNKAHNHHRYQPKSAVTAVGGTSAQGTTTIISTLQEHENNGIDHHCHNQHHIGAPSTSSTATTTARMLSSSGHHPSQKTGKGCSNSCDNTGNKLVTTAISPKAQMESVIPGSHQSNDLKAKENDYEQRYHAQQQQHIIRRKSRPSLIEEENSLSETENNSHVSAGSNKSSRQQHQLSPNKSYSKVGEIFSKISGKYSNSNSPVKLFSAQSTESSSPSKKSPTKVAPLGTGILQQNNKVNLLESQDDVVVVTCFNNNNYTRNQHNKDSVVVDDASVEEYTVTSLIVVPAENSPVGSN